MKEKLGVVSFNREPDLVWGGERWRLEEVESEFWKMSQR